MNPVFSFYSAIRQAFPQITALADVIHVRQWGELDPEWAYSWFESLAYALNDEMRCAADYAKHQPLFEFVSRALLDADDDLRQCIDVALVENLFWQFPGAKCLPYWRQLPIPLRELYLAFHRRPP